MCSAFPDVTFKNSEQNLLSQNGSHCDRRESTFVSNIDENAETAQILTKIKINIASISECRD